MATSYYIKNKAIEAFIDFWKTSIVPDVEEKVEAYLSSVDISEDDRDTIEDACRIPTTLQTIDDAARFGFLGNRGTFIWDGPEFSLAYSPESLRTVIERGGRVIVDENNVEISLEDFLNDIVGTSL